MKEDLNLGIRGNLQQGPELQRNLIKTTHIDTNDGCLPSSLSLFLSAIRNSEILIKITPLYFTLTLKGKLLRPFLTVVLISFQCSVWQLLSRAPQLARCRCCQDQDRPGLAPCGWCVLARPPRAVGSEKIIAMLHLNKEEQNLVLLNHSLPLSWHVFLSLCQKPQPVTLSSKFMNLIFV